jgi:hypothetical protein
MSHVIEVTDEQYERLRQTAEQQGQTPEELLNTLIAEGTGEESVYDNLDDFFQSLGASDEVIHESQRLFEEEEPHQGAADDANV